MAKLTVTVLCNEFDQKLLSKQIFTFNLNSAVHGSSQIRSMNCFIITLVTLYFLPVQSATNPFTGEGFIREESLVTPVELSSDETLNRRTSLSAEEEEGAIVIAYSGSSAQV